MKIIIIGTGNVATIFGRMFRNSGNEIVQVFGRNPLLAGELAKDLDSDACIDWRLINSRADLYFVAIADTALYELDSNLRLSNQVVVHTAGSVSKDVLKKISANYGVLYPLQTIRKQLPVLTSIPLLVDANNDYTIKTLLQMGKSLSSTVLPANDDERMKLHVAAVFINNFVNHLYAVAEDFCAKERVEFNLLFPLISETARRIEMISPQKVVTGPAVRNDTITINKHLDLLKSHPSLKLLYEQLTASIKKYSAGKT
jgi:predicted short-subunit dehydrogenase-like oxidoreductase (DUF2520 family)